MKKKYYYGSISYRFNIILYLCCPSSKIILVSGTYTTSGMPNSHIYISNTGAGLGNSAEITLYDNDVNYEVYTGRIRINSNG